MKNLSLILNIVLLLAVAYLYADRFSSKNETPTTAEPSKEASTDKPLKVVYINIDSLHSKSNSYQATKKELETSFDRVRATLLSKEKAFQKEVGEYQQKASSGLLTPNQAKVIEEGLAKKQQEIMKLQETASAELDNKTNAFDSKFTSDIKKYSDSLRVANGYDFVLLYGGVISPMLSADTSYDITDTVVELLNKDQ
ncbi:MAG: OmpH family outer membrane protein [Saprospiraceae bacterium]